MDLRHVARYYFVMETITLNLLTRAKKATRNGRDYLVAPVVMIVPGVLNGSQGALFYPPEEVEKSPSDWNHMPIVVGHPTFNGEPVSARDPSVLEKYGIGEIFDSLYDGRLKGNAWFDVERTRTIEARVLEALEKGEKIEVSTGLFTNNLPAQNGARDAKGREYQWIATNYRPDHLAILVGTVGACSVGDGCGVLVNCSCDVPPTDNTIVTGLYPNEHAARVRDPGQFQKDSFRRKSVAPGVNCVVGKGPNKDKAVVQSYRFARDKFTEEEARAWLRRNKVRHLLFEKAVAPVNNTLSLNQLSHEELRLQLSIQLRERFGNKSPFNNEYIDLWLVDVFDRFIVFNLKDKLYRLSYKSDLRNDKVELSDDKPVEVRRTAVYKAVKNEEERNGAALSDTPGYEELSPALEVTTVAKLNDSQRKQMVEALAANSNAPNNMPWKELSQQALSALHEDVLIAYHETYLRLLNNTGNDPRKGFTDGYGNRHVFNEVSNRWETTPPPIAQPIAQPVVPTVPASQVQPQQPHQPLVPVGNCGGQPAPAQTGNQPAVVHVPVKPKNTQEWLASIPDEAKPVWDMAQNIFNREKAAILEKLTANATTDESKQQLYAIYSKLPMDELQAMAAAMPQPQQQAQPQPQMPHFLGYGSAPPAVTNEEPLKAPVYNFSNRTRHN